jgi:hypothetical protein
MRTAFLAISASFLACGGNNNKTIDAPIIDSSVDAGSGSGSNPGSNGSSFAIDGFGNGLYWDATANALFFTEKVSGSGNALAKWTDAGGIEVVASLDGVGSANPGELVQLADGSFITPQFSSSNTNNGIIHIVGSTATLLLEAAGSGSGQGSNVGDYRSVGLTLGSNGTTIYQSAFTKGTSFAGFILQTVLTGSAAEQSVFAQGGGTNTVGKVVGLVANADGSFILGDQSDNTFWKVSAQGALTPFVAVYTHPDLLLQLPNGDLLDGGGSAIAGRTQAINHIALADGTVTPLSFPGFTFTYVGGMAYDPVGHRLFVDDQTGSANDTFDVLPYTP